MPLVFGILKISKSVFPRSKHQKRKDEICPFLNLVNFNLLQLIKSFYTTLYSASRTRTYDIMINSHALLPTELWRIKAKRLPYLTGGNPQLLPAF